MRGEEREERRGEERRGEERRGERREEREIKKGDMLTPLWVLGLGLGFRVRV